MDKFVTKKEFPRLEKRVYSPLAQGTVSMANLSRGAVIDSVHATNLMGFKKRRDFRHIANNQNPLSRSSTWRP